MVVTTRGSEHDTIVYVRTECSDDATELACSDDSIFGLQSLATVHGVTTGTTYYLFADAYDIAEGGDLELVAGIKHVLREGMSCDPTDIWSECAGALWCDPAIERCATTGEPPVLHDLYAWRLDDDRVWFVGHGGDGDANTDELRLVLEDDTGAFVVDELFTLDDSVSGEASFVASATVAGFESISPIVGVIGSLIDLAGNESNLVSADLMDLPRPGAGDVCDPEGVLSRCITGASCDEDSSVCLADEPPVLTDVTLFRVGPDIYHAVMTGSDVENDVRSFEHTFVNAEGGDVGAHLDMHAGFVDPVTGLASFMAQGIVDLTSSPGGGDTPAAATGIRFELVDGAGNQSNSVIAHWVELPNVSAGGSCDPDGFFNRCVDHHTCDRATERCAESLSLICAGPLETLISGVPVMGDSRGEFELSRGTCGGDGPEVVYELTLPADADVELTTDLRGTGDTDTVLYVREVCSDPDTELGCHDDVDGGSLVVSSTLRLSLTAGTYSVIVDTLSLGGPFELLAEW